ncbi:MAG: hypothetical protein KDH96_07455 [Candidatus Riesia sp.]|nr:hypothetical protein [Candidatus Riesia sp.]
MLIRVKTSTQAKKIMPGDHFRWEECKGFKTPRRNKNRTGLKFASYDIPVDVTSLPWTPAALENTSTEELNEEEDETNWNFLDFWNQDDD